MVVFLNLDLNVNQYISFAKLVQLNQKITCMVATTDILAALVKGFAKSFDQRKCVKATKKTTTGKGIICFSLNFY